ncbi:MAG: hypothetical protein ACREVH_07815 [Gammaproteobacteria bacterium]
MKYEIQERQDRYGPNAVGHKRAFGALRDEAAPRKDPAS